MGKALNTPAARLLHLAREDARLSKLLHRLTQERDRNREAALRIRVSMRRTDVEEYEALRLVQKIETEQAWPSEKGR